MLSRALGLVGTILLTRILPLDILGLLTLVQTCAQTTASLFRLGSNYSYTVLLPSRALLKSRLFLALAYSRLGTLLSIPFSIVVAIYTTGSIWKGSYAYITEVVSFPSLLALIIFMIAAECIGELLWSIIFPMNSFMNSVLFRDPIVSALKIALPLLFYSLWGLPGSLFSVLAISCLSLLGAMSVGSWHSLRIFYASLFVGKLSDIAELLRHGLAGYIFPLLTNLLMLPLLLKSASTEGVIDIGALRVGTWGAQIITVIGGSIAPVLLVKNSRGCEVSRALNKVADFCTVFYSLFFSVACFSVGYINDTLFLGKYSGYENLQLMVIAGAVLQSLVQLLLQCPLRPSQQLRVNVSLCLALLFGFFAIKIIGTAATLTSYALVPLAANIAFITILIFSKVLKSDLGVNSVTMAYLAVSCLSLVINLVLSNIVVLSIAIIAIWSLELLRLYARSKLGGQFG